MKLEATSCKVHNKEMETMSVNEAWNIKLTKAEPRIYRSLRLQVSVHCNSQGRDKGWDATWCVFCTYSNTDLLSMLLRPRPKAQHFLLWGNWGSQNCMGQSRNSSVSLLPRPWPTRDGPVLIHTCLFMERQKPGSPPWFPFSLVGIAVT